MDESQSIGAPVPVAGVSVLPNTTPTPTPATSNASAENAIGTAGKRKRGRPPRGLTANPPPPPPKRREEVEEEEDVCFICFDGGSLVLCDRKGCPKAYHPACIKRDEAFFSSDAKWFCGWHICSVCQKASHYICYTCTYSLCKGCAKNADYFSVRRNKGFCSICMKTIMLIENKDQGNNETVQVDFDDQSSWEYLFKMYWVCLKEKLSLTLSELIQAKNPLKESHRIQVKEEGSIMTRYKVSEKTEVHGTNISENPVNRATVDQAVDGSRTETSFASSSTAKPASTNISETDEMWRYRDPHGKIQGPFSMGQLRKWSTSGLFPPDMRIWTNDEHDDSVLLNDALNGQFQRAPLICGKTSSRSPERASASDDRNGPSKGSNSRSPECVTAFDDRNGASKGSNNRSPEHVTTASDDRNGTSKGSNSNTEKAIMDGVAHPFPKFLDLMNGNIPYADKLQLCSPAPSSLRGEVNTALSNQEKAHENSELHPALGHKIQDFCGNTMCQITDKSNQQNYVALSSGQNWGSLTSCRSSINLDAAFPSGTNSSNSFEKKLNVNLPDRPSPTTKSSYDDVETQAAEKLLSLSSGVPLRASDIQDWSSSAPKSNGEAKTRGVAAENKDSAPSNLSMQDSGATWSSASSLADESDGYSPAAKPSAEEWDSGLVSVSSLKPAEEVTNHVAPPTSIANQLNNHTSTSHEVPTISTWQAAVNEPIEFSTLAEESVSDLLAEVDAMESQTQSGVGSPTSAMRFSEQMIPGYKNFILALFEDLSPTHDPAKSDGLSPNGDIQLPCQSPLTDELVGASSQADAFDPLKRPDGNSSNKR